MEMQPLGYLPFAVLPTLESRLIFSPAYILPVEMLERGLVRRPKYIRQVVIVDGYDGRAMLLDKNQLMPEMDFVQGDVQKEYLELKISAKLAAEIAENEAGLSGGMGWKKVIRNRKVFVCTNEIKLVWRVYSVRDGKVLDTFTGETISSAGLLGMLFN